MSSPSDQRLISFDDTLRFTFAAPHARRLDDGSVVWATVTPDGLTGTLKVTRSGRSELTATAWGDGRHWLLSHTDDFVGGNDDPSGFQPPEVLRDQWKKEPFRVGRTNNWWEATLTAIFEQKVQGTKAHRSLHQLSRRFGPKAPGPYDLFALPSIDRVGAMAYYEFHPLGVERARSQSAIDAARELARLGRAITRHSPDQLCRRLERIHGIGPWTTATASIRAAGNPDAVPVGDYHIPNHVAWALANEPRGTDERMLELLAPFKGHRYRVIQLAERWKPAPKFGPRLSLLDDGLHRGK